MSDDQRCPAEAVIDAVRRTAIHYGLWFAYAAERFGLQQALEMEREAGDQGVRIILKRLAGLPGVDSVDGLPAPLARLDQAGAAVALEALAANWLALDGVWFQAVERRRGMTEAKAVNDACWQSFSPLEAMRIKALAGLPDDGGLAALAEALRHRLYASLNRQEIAFEEDGALVMRMVDCRVQSARKRKGLPDYPCKSAGIVEYTSFGEAVDARISCECIGCPPDAHPEGWYCAWRFRLSEPEPA